MTHETDLPCADCGTALVERSVDLRDLPIPAARDEAVTVARCPSCEAHYYPDQTLAALSDVLSPEHGGVS